MVVVRRAVPRRLARAAPDGDQGLRRAGLAGLGGHGRASTARRTTGRGAGRRRTSTSPPARSGPGCASRASGSSRWSAGPSAAGTPPPARATRCRASTSPGAPAPASSRRSSGGSARTWRPDGSRLRFRHRVDDLVTTDGVVTGVRGHGARAGRRRRAACRSNRDAAGEFELLGPGGGRHVRRHRRQPRPGPGAPGRSGSAPRRSGCSPASRPTSTAGCSASPQRAGGEVINPDRMWHYVEGIENWDPVWPGHGIRILPGPSSLWLDGAGRRLPVPLFPGFDTLGTLEHLRHSGFDHSWFVLTPEDHREGVRALRARSRTPTSPARTSARCCSGCGPARRRRSRRSSATAPTSSWPTPWPSWSRA